MMVTSRWWRITAVILWLSGGAAAADEDALFKDFDPAAVNQGALEWVADSAPVHRQLHRLTVTPDGLATGWVRLYQCHYQLDPVDRIEVVFRPGRVRALHVESFQGMDMAGVEGDSVQMRGVHHGAQLCLSAETRALQPAADGNGFVLRNGPFMRRFLDGYYVLQLELEVRLPDGRWRLAAMEPQLQPGLVADEGDRLKFIARFKGRLETMLEFESIIE